MVGLYLELRNENRALTDISWHGVPMSRARERYPLARLRRAPSEACAVEPSSRERRVQGVGAAAHDGGSTS